jgi:hypothetical protein
MEIYNCTAYRPFVKIENGYSVFLKAFPPEGSEGAVKDLALRYYVIVYREKK